MKKIGIVADNYKTARFEKELTALGYTFETTTGQALTSIVVQVPALDFEAHKNKIHALCTKVEAHFKRRN